MKNNQGRGVVLIERGVINFLLLNRGGLLEGGGLFERWGGGLNRGFTVIKKLTKYKLYELVETVMRMSSFFVFDNYYLF